MDCAFSTVCILWISWVFIKLFFFFFWHIFFCMKLGENPKELLHLFEVKICCINKSENENREPIVLFRNDSTSLELQFHVTWEGAKHFLSSGILTSGDLNEPTATVDGNPHNCPFSFAEFLKQFREYLECIWIESYSVKHIAPREE